MIKTHVIGQFNDTMDIVYDIEMGANSQNSSIDVIQQSLYRQDGYVSYPGDGIINRDIRTELYWKDGDMNPHIFIGLSLGMDTVLTPEALFENVPEGYHYVSGKDLENQFFAEKEKANFIIYNNRDNVEIPFDENDTIEILSDNKGNFSVRMDIKSMDLDYSYLSNRVAEIFKIRGDEEMEMELERVLTPTSIDDKIREQRERERREQEREEDERRRKFIFEENEKLHQRMQQERERLIRETLPDFDKDDERDDDFDFER